jgi:hypothetical protein
MVDNPEVPNINGYRIREAMKQWHNRRQIASTQYNNSLYYFEGEDNLPLDQVVKNFQQADENYAKLQELQQWYNARVIVDTKNADGKPVMMSLSYAVKVLGGAGRVEKMWRDACSEKQDRYGNYGRDRERDKDKEYAKRSVSIPEATKRVEAASRYSMFLRSEIAKANNTSVNIGDDVTCPITLNQWKDLLGG